MAHRDRTFSISILNRAFTLFRFSPQLALIHEARATNAQALDYDRNRAGGGSAGRRCLAVADTAWIASAHVPPP